MVWVLELKIRLLYRRRGSLWFYCRLDDEIETLEALVQDEEGRERWLFAGGVRRVRLIWRTVRGAMLKSEVGTVTMTTRGVYLGVVRMIRSNGYILRAYSSMERIVGLTLGRRNRNRWLASLLRRLHRNTTRIEGVERVSVIKERVSRRIVYERGKRRVSVYEGRQGLEEKEEGRKK